MDIITYCVDVVDHSMADKRKSMGELEGDPIVQRKFQGALFAEEVKVRPHLRILGFSVHFPFNGYSGIRCITS